MVCREFNCKSLGRTTAVPRKVYLDMLDGLISGPHPIIKEVFYGKTRIVVAVVVVAARFLMTMIYIYI